MFVIFPAIRQAPPITNLLYADDLLLMGSATRGEARHIHAILDTFCKMSGQRASPEKSKLWFSKATPLAQIRSVLHIFRAGFADNSESYLGGPVDVFRPSSFNPLPQKFDNRLHAWKAKLLSPAGKMVLLKSVLESLSIYPMSTTLIHKSVLDRIRSKCVQFFWGKGEKKAVCFVKWDFLTCPKAEGGLGLRSLEETNKAMILKVIWKITSGSNALWVQVMKSKYHPTSPFWITQRISASTRLWKAIVQNKTLLKHFSRWVLGDGQTCNAYAQPWFSGWDQMAPPSCELQQAKVAFFFNQQILVWNQHYLVQFRGSEFAKTICNEQANTILRPGTKDKLMFTWVKNGEFSVKAAYHLLRNSQPLTSRHVSEQETIIWKKIWKILCIPQKVRMFFWKAMQGALPTAAALSKRIPSIEPDCKLCGMTREDVLHTLFLCQHARATWFSSPLS